MKVERQRIEASKKAELDSLAAKWIELEHIKTTESQQLQEKYVAETLSLSKQLQGIEHEREAAKERADKAPQQLLEQKKLDQELYDRTLCNMEEEQKRMEGC